MVTNNSSEHRSLSFGTWVLSYLPQNVRKLPLLISVTISNIPPTSKLALRDRCTNSHLEPSTRDGFLASWERSNGKQATRLEVSSASRESEIMYNTSQFQTVARWGRWNSSCEEVNGAKEQALVPKRTTLDHTSVSSQLSGRKPSILET